MRFKLNFPGARRVAAVCGVVAITAMLALPTAASADMVPIVPIMRAPATSQTVDANSPTEGFGNAFATNNETKSAQTATANQQSPLAGKRVGIQAGHWQTANMPSELASLRTSTGGSGGGVREVDLALEYARKVESILESKGAIVDVLPATVPVNYEADAFVSIHCDATGSSAPRGFKAASSPNSAVSEQDQALVDALYEEYGEVTGLPTNGAISNNMLYYYAFSSNRFQHTVAKTTPAAIFETGFLTNPTDRSYLVNHSDQVSQGIAQGIIEFLSAA